MSRPLRIHFAGAVYHVMNRRTARQASFLNDGDYQAFLNTLAGMYKIQSDAKGDRQAVWVRELRGGGMVLARSAIKDGEGEDI